MHIKFMCYILYFICDLGLWLHLGLVSEAAWYDPGKIAGLICNIGNGSIYWIYNQVLYVIGIMVVEFIFHY